ncbi:MAG TPA: hypothetical protein VFG20_13960 [Planctomycetaceae bacterium]|nr:hypothetical protein [Planctomycetaceae bacterium]
MVRAFILSLVLLTGFNGTADAAVRGSKFVGTINAATGNSATATLNFALIGDARTEAQDIGGIINSYPGTYTEFSISVFSYWTGDFTGAETYEASGFSFFGVVTSYSLTNEGVDAASGWLWRDGIADLP